jgi:hypothetical protein
MNADDHQAQQDERQQLEDEYGPNPANWPLPDNWSWPKRSAWHRAQGEWLKQISHQPHTVVDKYRREK